MHAVETAAIVEGLMASSAYAEDDDRCVWKAAHPIQHIARIVDSEKLTTVPQILIYDSPECQGSQLFSHIYFICAQSRI